MLLREYLPEESIALDFAAIDRPAAIGLGVDLLRLGERSRATILRQLSRRELVGTTAVGHAIAIPHCRTMAVHRITMAYLRLATPLTWEAPDNQPVRHVFLIIAPPMEVSNQYLPALARLAGLARQAEFRAALSAAKSAAEVLDAMARH